MEEKILKIQEIQFDKTVYPRSWVDYRNSNRYAKAMKSDVVFPVITVARYEETYILVDGAHRLEAYKFNKEKYVKAEILTGLTKKEMYIEAVKRNIGNGKQFNAKEVTKIIITLKDWKLSENQIEKLVRIPVNEIEPFIANRIARIGTREVVLKSPLKNLAGTQLNFKSEKAFNAESSKFTEQSQNSIINNTITLLKNDWIDATDKKVMSKLKSLYLLLKAMFE